MSDITINEVGYGKAPYAKKLILHLMENSMVGVTLRGRRGVVQGYILVERADLERALLELHNEGSKQ